MNSSTRGFTLVEMLISLTLLGLVSGLSIRLLLTQHWSGVAQGERGALQASLRAGTLYLSSELRELGGTPGDPDIIAFAPESLTYRAMRGVGVSCQVTQGVVSLDTTHYSGYRSPQAGRDSLLLYQEGREESAADDHWIRLPIQSVGAGNCTSTPALFLGTSLDTALYPVTSFSSLAPVRTFEVMQLKLYQSGGDHWLGARSVSAGETIQPLIGPLEAHGLTLAYRDSLESPAGTPEDVRSIEITLRGLSAGAIRSGAGYGAPGRRRDSLRTRVRLRNW